MGSLLDRTTQNENGSFNGMKPFAEASTSEEPGAGKLHAAVCTGVAGQPAFLPQSQR